LPPAIAFLDVVRRFRDLDLFLPVFVNDGLSILILTNTEEANPPVIANALADY
jgi:hypothetical protein